MKNVCARVLLFAGVVGFGLAGAGCGGISMDRLNARQFVDARFYAGDVEAIHAAARAALEAMNYSFVKGSRADGTLEMMSGVQPGGSALNARQRRAFVSVTPGDTGGSKLRIGFMETSEDVSPGGTVSTSNRAVREAALYQAFWVRLAGQLGLPDPPPQPLGLDL